MSMNYTPKKIIQMPLRIGVDMGGVCVRKGRQYEDDTKQFNRVMDMPKCIESLQALRAMGHYLVLVSFCGRSRAENTSKTLSLPDHKELFDELYFVKDKSFKDNIAKHLGLDVMIDDRWDILEKMNSIYRLHFIQDVPENKIPKKTLEEKRKI